MREPVLRAALLCHEAFRDDAHRACVLHVWDRKWAPQIPVNVSTLVYIRMGDLTAAGYVQADVVDATDTVLWSSGAQTFDAPGDPGADVDAWFSIPGVQIRAFGPHWINIIVNGHHIGSAKFLVRKPAPKPTPDAEPI